MNSIKDYLKSSIPEFQQSGEMLNSFLDAGGEFLDEIKEAIESFSDSKDWHNGTVYSVEKTLIERGSELPANLKNDSKRKYLRDVSEIIIKSGTEDSIRHALKLIGFDSTINKAWIQNPEFLNRGLIKNIKTGEIYSSNIGKYFFLDMVYGDAHVTPDGTFFSGKDYFEIFDDENTITNIPIVGESYDGIQIQTNSVGSTPYVLVQLEGGDFSVDVAEYYSPETGRSYTYSVDERVALIDDIVNFFISGKGRPTTVRVIIIVAYHYIEDEIIIEEEYEEIHTYTSDGDDDLDEIISLTSNLPKIGTVSVGTAPIGTNLIVGNQSPFAHQLSIIESVNVGLLPTIIDKQSAFIDEDGNLLRYYDLTFSNEIVGDDGDYKADVDPNVVEQASVTDDGDLVVDYTETYLETPQQFFLEQMIWKESQHEIDVWLCVGDVSKQPVEFMLENGNLIAVIDADDNIIQNIRMQGDDLLIDYDETNEFFKSLSLNSTGNAILEYSRIYPYIPTRPLMEISFINTSNTQLKVFTANNDINGNKVDNFIGVVDIGEHFNYETTPFHHFIKILPNTIEEDSIGVTFKYNEFVQEIP
jgi:hypothetical protein